MIQAGVRRKRNAPPRIEPNGDGAVLRYNCNGVSIGTYGTSGCSASRRIYIPGYDSTIGVDTSDLIGNAGTSIVSYYASAKFLPGTKIRWEPSCSFTTTGRIYVGFVDNPEVARTLLTQQNTFRSTFTAADYNTYANNVKALGSVVSFPVWQETEIAFPTKLRRKRYDCNETTLTDDTLDRSMQTMMFIALEGGPTTATIFGNFWYHDVVDVEGLHVVPT